MSLTRSLIIALFSLLFATQFTSVAFAQAQSGKTELLWLGQAGFRIKTPGG